jgi:hypothetical protein
MLQFLNFESIPGLEGNQGSDQETFVPYAKLIPVHPFT